MNKYSNKEVRIWQKEYQKEMALEKEFEPTKVEAVVRNLKKQGKEEIEISNLRGLDTNHIVIST
ncbi:MAG: hypothetical protein ACFFAS_07400 [Promethearchaeota archaeon]